MEVSVFTAWEVTAPLVDLRLSVDGALAVSVQEARKREAEISTATIMVEMNKFVCFFIEENKE